MRRNRERKANAEARTNASSPAVSPTAKNEVSSLRQVSLKVLGCTLAACVIPVFNPNFQTWQILAAIFLMMASDAVWMRAKHSNL